MAIKIKKNGKIEQFTLHSTDVKVLDLEGKFKKKDLESVIREISDTEHIHIGEVDTTKDGIWIDAGETLDNSENNGVVERLKEYVDNKIELVKLVNVEVDFNELEDGRYLINTTKEYLKNAPNSIVHGGILTVNRCSEGLSQILISDEDRVYYRKKWYVYWGEWNELMSANQISNPNLLINGDFQVWQRGTSFDTGGYTVDRWAISTDVNSYNLTKTDEGVQITLNEVGDGEKDLAFLETLEQTDVIPLRGKKVTFSVALKLKNVTSGNLRISLYTGTTPNQFASADGRIALHKDIKFSELSSNEFRTFQITSNVIDDNVNSLTVIVRTGSDGGFINEGGSFIVKQAKLELGSVATPFVPRLYGEELALCQRYYFRNRWKTLRTAVITSKELRTCEYNFPVKMRVAPTIRAIIEQPVSQLYTVDLSTNIYQPIVSQIASMEIGLLNESMCDFQFSISGIEVKDYTIEIKDYAYEFDAEIY